MMVEVAKTQDDEVGDGTTTAVVIAGELLGKAEDLIEKNVHPTVIIDGYRKAADKALETLEKIAISVKPADKEFLKKVASTGEIAFSDFNMFLFNTVSPFVVYGKLL